MVDRHAHQTELEEIEVAFGNEKAMLTRAEKDRNPVGPLSDVVPGGLTLHDAHTICEGNIRARLEAGSRDTDVAHAPFSQPFPCPT
jgi:hypothetical protein